jgi:hypothetical protein
VESNRAKAPSIVGLALVALLALVAVGCSPESQRVRGGGQGADVGNRYLGPSLDVHGPVNPLFGEPLDSQVVSAGRSSATPAAK